MFFAIAVVGSAYLAICSPAHGLVIDNLVGVTLVTADGSIRSVNSSENADLYWGVRGGGCNFGVVTEFVYKVHPQRSTVYTGHVIFPSSALKKLIALTEVWWTKGPSEKEAMMHLLIRGPDGNVGILTLFHGAEILNKICFDSLASLSYSSITALKLKDEWHTKISLISVRLGHLLHSFMMYLASTFRTYRGFHKRNSI